MGTDKNMNMNILGSTYDNTYHPLGCVFMLSNDSNNEMVSEVGIKHTKVLGE